MLSSPVSTTVSAESKTIYLGSPHKFGPRMESNKQLSPCNPVSEADFDQVLTETLIEYSEERVIQDNSRINLQQTLIKSSTNQN